MMGTEQPAQILLPTTEIVGSISIANPFRTETANQRDPTIQPTIVPFKQANVPGNSDHKYFPIGSLNSGMDVPRSAQNIDNLTDMNPWGTIVTTKPEYNRENNCNVLELVIRTSYLAYRVLTWNGTMKS